MRSKIRIMRGYIFNWLLIGISGGGYLCGTIHKDLSDSVFWVSIALAAITLLLYIYNEILCSKRIGNFCEAIKNKPGNPDPPNTIQAATPPEIAAGKT